MFIIDDALMSPFKGFLFIAKEVQKACEQQLESDRAQLMGQLTALHKMLEQGEISEDDFDEKEAELLEKLEKFEQ
ncbi:gas vesicle protein GvpG [Pirellulaceae bacterium SH501]